MATRSEIYFNYNQAINQARRLEDIARNVERLSNNDMNNTVSEIQTAWQSDSSRAYISKAQRVQGNIVKDAAKVRKVASTIRDTAERIKNAELAALEIAERRTYNL